jgi:hypothetical protein
MAEGKKWRPGESRHGEKRPIRYRSTLGKAAAVAVASPPRWRQQPADAPVRNLKTES